MSNETIGYDEELALLTKLVDEGADTEGTSIPMSVAHGVANYLMAAGVRAPGAKTDSRTPVVQQGPGPALFIEGDSVPVMDLHTTDLDSSLHAAIAADRLSLGWVLAGYDCPDDLDSVHEFRLVAWRQLTSEIGPLATEHIALNVKHEDEAQPDEGAS